MRITFIAEQAASGASTEDPVGYERVITIKDRVGNLEDLFSTFEDFLHACGYVFDETVGFIDEDLNDEDDDDEEMSDEELKEQRERKHMPVEEYLKEKMKEAEEKEVKDLSSKLGIPEKDAERLIKSEKLAKQTEDEEDEELIGGTLPGSASIGDEISIIDYAGTFDTNNLTVGRNSHKIQGSAADLTVSTERAGFTLVYVDSTQGWLLKDK